MLVHVESGLGSVALDREVRSDGDVGQEGSRFFSLRGDSPPDALVLNRLSMTNAYYEGKAAGSLEVTGVGGVSGEGSTITIVQDNYRAGAGERANGRTEMWGAAVRICVTVAGLKGEGKLSLPMVAVQAEMGQVKAGYRFEILGVSDLTSVADSLPTVGAFDTQSYVALIEAVNTCTTAVLKMPVDSLSPALLYVDLDPTTPATIAWSFVQALAAIAQGHDPHDADQKGTEVDDGVVAAVQADLAAEPHGTDPKAWARHRLESFRERLGGALDG